MNKANLFFIGPIKSGTTSLSSYFNQIQDVYVPIVKENHFFTDLVNEKFKDTTMQLPQSARHSFQISKLSNYELLFQTNRNFKYFLDASPTYFVDPKSAKKIYQYNKNAKILISYRDPFERLISHANMVKRIKKLNNSIVEIILDDFNRDKAKQFHDSYLVEYSLYHKALLSYSQYFDKSQILVFSQSKLFKNTEENFIKILSALNIEKLPPSLNFHKKNQNSFLAQNRTLKKASKITPQLIKNFIISVENKYFGNQQYILDPFEKDKLESIIQIINKDKNQFLSSSKYFTQIL